jgi:hypothetical protein
MATDEDIRKLAYNIWEKEGRPDDKDVEHYLRAKKILEEREANRIKELAPVPQIVELAPPKPVAELAQAPNTSKRSIRARHKE